MLLVKGCKVDHDAGGVIGDADSQPESDEDTAPATINGHYPDFREHTLNTCGRE